MQLYIILKLSIKTFKNNITKFGEEKFDNVAPKLPKFSFLVYRQIKSSPKKSFNYLRCICFLLVFFTHWKKIFLKKNQSVTSLCKPLSN